MRKAPAYSARESSRPSFPYLLAPFERKVSVGVSEVLLKGREQIHESDDKNDDAMGRCEDNLSLFLLLALRCCFHAGPYENPT
jgi:hypothetical protein